MDSWYRITHPVPRRRIGPPDPGDPLDRFGPFTEVARRLLKLVREAYTALLTASPDLSESVRQLMVDQERVLQRQRGELRRRMPGGSARRRPWFA